MTDADEIRRRIGDRRVVASVSGGKDSAALSGWLSEQGIDHDRVFIDTHNEHDAIYHAVMSRERAFVAAREASERLASVVGEEPRTGDEIRTSLDELDRLYGEEPLARALGPIRVISAAVSFAEAVVDHGMFPSRQIQFCTKDLKGDTIARFFAGLDEPAINAVGVRAGESANRAELSEWEWSDALDADVWRPIIRWSERDVVEFLRRRAIPLNHLYAVGMSRVGCFPCKNLHGEQFLQFVKVSPPPAPDDAQESRAQGRRRRSGAIRPTTRDLQRRRRDCADRPRSPRPYRPSHGTAEVLFAAGDVSAGQCRAPRYDNR